MRKTITLLTICLAINLGFSQNVYIPDANFKTALLTGPNSGIDTNGDGEIQVSEAQAWNSPIDVTSKNISDLTGIEAFINIDILACGGNNLTSLNLNQNTKLERLFCMNNQIGSLTLSNNSNLTLLYCYGNNLTRLNVSNSNNSAITIFNASNNPNLKCIQVDRYFTPPSFWTKDATAVFSNYPCKQSIDPIRTLLSSTGGLGDPLKTVENTSIYPNPTSDIITIKSSEKIKKVEVYTLNGDMVLESTSKSLNTSKLEKGMYSVRIVSDKNEIIHRKLIKE